MGSIEWDGLERTIDLFKRTLETWIVYICVY